MARAAPARQAAPYGSTGSAAAGAGVETGPGSASAAAGGGTCGAGCPALACFFFADLARGLAGGRGASGGAGASDSAGGDAPPPPARTPAFPGPNVPRNPPPSNGSSMNAASA